MNNAIAKPLAEPRMSSEHAHRILVVEDDDDLRRLLMIHLKDFGFEVDSASDGVSGCEQAFNRAYDLVILDLMLPGIDGLELCRRLRRDSKRYIHVLMLTSRASEAERIIGLEMGADDYVTKPFSLLEFLARVKAIFRRMDALTPEATQTERFDVGPITLDLGARAAWLNGRSINVTSRELDLLAFFARNPGRAYTRAQLLNAVWGVDYDGDEHTVNSHINRLRAKIEQDPQHPKYILTVWGIGYKFSEDILERAD